MAQMFPVLSDLELSSLEATSRAEAEVYRAFRDQAPAAWLVLHGVNLIAQPPGLPPRDAEADFVVFDPTRGFVVVEVKGGGISRDGGGQWWSTGRRGMVEIKDPFRQANANKHQVLAFLRASHAWGPGGAPRLLIGHAVLLPDVSSVSALIGPDRPQQILGSGTDIRQLGFWIDGVFGFWSTQNAAWRPLGTTGMAVVRSTFCSSVTVRRSLALDIEREQRRQFDLTQRQARVLQNLNIRTRAAVAGAAGTGKTLLALQHGQALAAQGRRTLLVCYTRALADSLKREARDVDNLEIMSFHQLCDWRVKAVKDAMGVDLFAEARKSYPNGDEFAVQKPYALAESTAHDPLRYQAILVDEGQDFGDEYWLPLDFLLAEDAQFYVFYDANQAIYQRVSCFPELGPALLLTENCRNTAPIHEASYRYYKGHEVGAPELAGEPLTCLASEGLAAQTKSIRNTIATLLREGGLKPEQVVVLVVTDRKDPYFRALHASGSFPGGQWSFEELWKPGCVLVDTARRFKGLEADAVILWVDDEVDPVVERELLYVALSRVRNRLWLIGSEARIGQVLRGSGS